MGISREVYNKWFNYLRCVLSDTYHTWEEFENASIGQPRTQSFKWIVIARKCRHCSRCERRNIVVTKQNTITTTEWIKAES